MRLMMMLALGSKPPQQKSQTFTSNGTWTAPVGKIDAVSGFGARGSESSGTLVRQYNLRTYDHVVNADGSTANNTLGNYGPYSGVAPADYCDPLGAPNASGTRSQVCYDYTDTSYTQGGGTTTGASATAFSKTFPGSAGNVAPNVTTYQNLAVTTGNPYPITVPAGGSITITWTE